MAFYNAFILSSMGDEFCIDNQIFHSYSLAERICEDIVKNNDVHGYIIVEVSQDNSWRIVGEKIDACEYTITNNGPRIVVEGKPSYV